MLRFRYQPHPRKMAVYPNAGQGERLQRLREIVTGLFRYERLELNYNHADEARQYAERLILLALRNGDKHKETMELADYWLLEKDLVHKLFKVLVPRFQKFKGCFTDLHKLALEYPGTGAPTGLLELRGNPWPPVVPRQRDFKYTLSNMLLAAARQDFYQSRQEKISQTKNAASLKSTQDDETKSSSVDPVLPSSKSDSVSQTSQTESAPNR
uniref:Large ribosomal subunit protein bL17m n=1 Tax=Biomphalaria glabrata TaxID=6526 RepID=A0A2C9JE22_BIOGL